jgi:hypothetical protein
MGFWILYLIVLIIIITIYSAFEQIITLIKNDKKMIIPILIGMFIGYLIFF